MFSSATTACQEDKQLLVFRGAETVEQRGRFFFVAGWPLGDQRIHEQLGESWLAGGVFSSRIPG